MSKIMGFKSWDSGAYDPNNTQHDNDKIHPSVAKAMINHVAKLHDVDDSNHVSLAPDGSGVAVAKKEGSFTRIHHYDLPNDAKIKKALKKSPNPKLVAQSLVHGHSQATDLPLGKKPRKKPVKKAEKERRAKEIPFDDKVDIKNLFKPIK